MKRFLFTLTLLLALTVALAGAFPQLYLAPTATPGEVFFVACPDQPDWWEPGFYPAHMHLYYTPDYGDTIIAPYGLDTVSNVWFDQELELLITLSLRRDDHGFSHNDSTYVFSWDRGTTREPGPVFNPLLSMPLSFEPAPFPGEFFGSSSWSIDTLITWKYGDNDGSPPPEYYYGPSSCVGWGLGESYYTTRRRNDLDSTLFVYRAWNNNDTMAVIDSVKHIPAGYFLTRGFSPGELYSLYDRAIYCTTDTGHTWQRTGELLYPPEGGGISFDLRCGWGPGELLAWHRSIEDKAVVVAYSQDYGATWEVLYEHPPGFSGVVEEPQIAFPSTPTLTLWPNPTNGLARFTWSGTGRGVCTLYDLLGRQMQIGEVMAGNVRMLDLNNLASGMYVLRVMPLSGSSGKG
ncbi:MAG: T9SS type A sorting domain-containing protein, partial [bacterium]